MSTEVLNFDPDPKVLLALTHTPLRPLDALCELIDNGLDSFNAARLQGFPVHQPMLKVSVPGETEARRGDGLIRVIDNGAGLDRDGLSNALRAGYSDKNKYDTLGLFGMGFNIATGKLGQLTTVTTARSQDDYALRVVIDLPAVVRSGKFEAPVEQVEKPSEFDHGTVIEVRDWWPTGNSNSDFSIQLSRISKPQLRDQIGRRYGTSLRRTEGRVRMIVNEEDVVPFEHCVWSAQRFVERQGSGRIYAQYEFDQVILSQRRCQRDGAVVNESSDFCTECGQSDYRTVEERVRGWVGIQRFDDDNKFGIDLIRNGRAIRVAEKEAFFNYLEDLESMMEYPTDQRGGRIVGEVHLDHVPVDFQKQDFQRSSEEWVRAIEFLRGGSLLPSKWSPGQKNDTYVSKLFQGFRKVRNYGRQHMYMGRWDDAAGKAVRIAREVEQEYYRRFLNREPGYYDDAKWWDLVVTATDPPIPAFDECPECGYQNRPGQDVCEDCGHILKGKQCIQCQAELARAATLCEKCGASQIPEVREPWQCNVCNATNNVDDERCGTCNCLRGDVNPMSAEVLRTSAERLREFSFDRRVFQLADGHDSEPLALQAMRTGGVIRPAWNGERIPSFAVRAAGAIELFIDLTHPLFTHLGIRPEEAVAVEAAQYLYNTNNSLAGKPAHSVQNIAAVVLAEVWGESIVSGPDKLYELCRVIFNDIGERLSGNPDSADFYDELDQFEERELADRLISASLLDQLRELRSSGDWFRYAPSSVIARFFDRKPDRWFDSVWRDVLPDPAEVGAQTAGDARTRLVGILSRCLWDCADYLRFHSTESAALKRVQASYQYLDNHLK